MAPMPCYNLWTSGLPPKYYMDQANSFDM